MRCEPHCQDSQDDELAVLPSLETLLSQTPSVFLTHPMFVMYEGKDSAVPPCLPLSPTAVSVSPHHLGDLYVCP